jgi:hypothetical protein
MRTSLVHHRLHSKLEETNDVTKNSRSGAHICIVTGLEFNVLKEVKMLLKLLNMYDFLFALL